MSHIICISHAGCIFYNETQAYRGVASYIGIDQCFLSKIWSMGLLICNFQVEGQLSLLSGAILTFGLTRYPYSEFELMAEELLMSDSTIKVFFFPVGFLWYSIIHLLCICFICTNYCTLTWFFPQVFGALRMSVKMLLMWNSRMEIDGGGDSIVATSLLDASNLIVLKVSSWSNVNYCFSILLLVLSMHNYCSYVFRNHLWYTLMLILEFVAKVSWICLGTETQLRHRSLFFRCSTAYKYDINAFQHQCLFLDVTFLMYLFIAAKFLSASHSNLHFELYSVALL